MRRCRVCRCSDDYCSGCERFSGRPCKWAGPSLCSVCQRHEPKGANPAGWKVWLWRMAVGCMPYKIVKAKPTYHQNPKDSRPLLWVVFRDVAHWTPTWYVRVEGPLDSMLGQGVIVRRGGITGYWRDPEGVGYGLANATK